MALAARTTPDAYLNFRRTPEDTANLETIAEALRPVIRKPFITAADVLRTALRVTASAARRGELAEALRRHSAELAG